MNINQQQSILNSIKSIKEIDINKLLVEKYPNENDLKRIIITNHSASNIIIWLNRVLNQFEEELKSDIGLFLPNRENFNNDFGQVTLDLEFIGLLEHIQASQFEAVEVLVEKFVYYQIRNGFWDKSKIKSHPVDNEEIKRQFFEIELNKKAIESNIATFTNLENQYSKSISQVEEARKSLNEQLGKIEGLVEESTLSVDQIRQYVSSSSNKETEIAGILKSISNQQMTLETDIQAYQQTFEKIVVDSEQLKRDLEDNLNSSERRLGESKAAYDFVLSKKSEIELLTGMAADGSLGSKFHQRQENLDKGLSFWKWSIVVMSVASIGWIAVVFTLLKANFSNVWIDFVVNLLKTTPAFILLGFVFNQYSKERNLQEEYAFKSAVAMTLTAYSAMLKEDSEDNKSKQLMLLKSIEQLYQNPKIHNDRKETIFALNTKHLRESIQTLSEAIKNIKE